MLPRPSLKEKLQFILLGPRDLVLYLVCLSYDTFRLAFNLLSPRYLAWSSRTRYIRAFYRAIKNVPAYRRYIEEQGATSVRIPETDKESYINAFSIEDRCVKGKFLSSEKMIDESSGSTGTPYNWIRSLKERHNTQAFITYFSIYCYGQDPWITVNTFSMGSWATGINMGEALQSISTVKNTGPDIPKIFRTLSFFGPKYPYLILGYPPFLKALVDFAESSGFPLKDYKLNACVGGEGMAEGLRDYLLKHFKLVYSGYGASDIEIGVAGETPLSVAIRRLARSGEKVRAKLFGRDSRLPMLFQYNPLMHYIEVNEKKEIVITITRSSILSPRIRYNIHDEGCVARYDEMAKSLAEEGHDIEKIGVQAGKKNIRLPFLWIYGRRDSTISVMGANIYPEDLEQSIYAYPELARITRSFCQSLLEMPGGKVRPCFYIEIEVEPSGELQQSFSESIFKKLKEINADFREACHEYSEVMIPEIKLYRIGEGPFKQDAGRIKQRRIINKKSTL